MQLDATFSPDAVLFNGNSRVRFNGAITPDYTIMSTMSLSFTGAYPRWIAEPGFPTVYFHTSTGLPLKNYAVAFNLTTYGGVSTYDTTFNTYATSFVPPENMRFHIAIRHQEAVGKVELFINGIKVGETTAVVPDGRNESNAYLGGRNSGATRFLSGEISNFMRYDRVLTDGEIAQNALVDSMRFINSSPTSQIT